MKYFKIKYLILFVVCLTTFRSMFYEVFKIPSGSMIPSLMIGDFILVNKFAYGFKVPFSENLVDISLEKPVYLTPFTPPKRGDIVVFSSPQNTSVYMVKRLIGTPGDKVEINNKVLSINGVKVCTKPIDGKKIMEDMDDIYKKERFRFYECQLGRNKFTMQVLDEKSLLEPTVYEVPQGEYFFVGDNRDHSYDSRFYGFVPEKYILGKAFMVAWSMIFPWNDHPTRHRPYRSGIRLD